MNSFLLNARVMRCPKCGYTSFDDLEHCKKCKKNIADSSAMLMGAVASAASPSFLWLTESEPKKKLVHTVEAMEKSGAEDTLFLLEEDGQTDETQPAVPQSPDNATLDLHLDSLGQPHSTQREPALELELDPTLDDTALTLNGVEHKTRPSLDLAALDISDLQAPLPRFSQPEGIELTLDLAGMATAEQAAQPSTTRIGMQEFSLEDLQVDDLELENPYTLTVGNEADQQYQPAIHTGTALDSFDFELDELFQANGNEKT
ncbi:MAG: hypothetical protein ACOX4Z_06440 [Desulfobulbus sp.]